MSETKYDELGSVIEQTSPITDTQSSKVLTFYDAAGNKSKEKELQAGTNYTETEYVYDITNKLIGVASKDFEGTVINATKYQYSAEGDMITKVTGLSSLDTTIPETGISELFSITRYVYNSAHQAIKMTDPEGKIETYKYNIEGQLKSKVDRNGQTTVMKYDGSGKLVYSGVVANDGTLSKYNLIYDDQSKLIKSNNTEFEYDIKGNLTKEYIDNGVNKVIEKNYTYDDKDRRTNFNIKINGETKFDLTYTYDNFSKISSIKEGGTTVASYLYDGFGRRINDSRAGITTDYSYNLADLPTTIENKIGETYLNSFTYNYTNNGLQSQSKEFNGTALTETPTKTVNYIYDALNRLTDENTGENNTTQSFTFDLNNNRATQTVDTNTKNFAYDQVGHLTSSGENNFTFDDNGNQIAAKGRDYKFDGNNRLKQVTEDSNVIASYQYDQTGIRTQKTIGTNTTTFVYDGDQLVLELDNNYNIAKKYVRGTTLIYEQLQGLYSSKLYPIYNAHGDVKQLIDPNAVNKIVKEYDYDSFGNELNPAVSDENPFRFSSEYFDKETGFQYLRARYFDPVEGRFITEDTYSGEIEDPLSLNLYTYCYNDGVNKWDPSGNYVQLWQWGNLVYGLGCGLLSSVNPWDIITGFGSLASAIPQMLSYTPAQWAEIGFNAIFGDVLEIVRLLPYVWDDSSHSDNDFYWLGYHSGALVSGLVAKFLGVGLGGAIAGISKAISKISKAIKVVKKAGKIVEKVASKVSALGSKLKRAASKVKCVVKTAIKRDGVRYCFTADTLISTDTGLKPISDIKVGDQVYSQNPETAEKGLKTVKQVFVNETDVLVHIYSSQDEIKATESHPFWVEGKGWINAGDLKVGDVLRLNNGTTETLENVTFEQLIVPVKVYNFEVEDWHTYYVGRSEILVHNKCFQAGKAFKSGYAAEEYLYEVVGGTRNAYFKTNEGRRFVDVLSKSKKIAYESKVGYASATEFIKRQVRKDAELLEKKLLKKVEWHFFRSGRTGKVGLTPQLEAYIRSHGITPIVHP